MAERLGSRRIRIVPSAHPFALLMFAKGLQLAACLVVAAPTASNARVVYVTEAMLYPAALRNCEDMGGALSKYSAEIGAKAKSLNAGNEWHIFDICAGNSGGDTLDSMWKGEYCECCTRPDRKFPSVCDVPDTTTEETAATLFCADSAAKGSASGNGHPDPHNSALSASMKETHASSCASKCTANPRCSTFTIHALGWDCTLHAAAIQQSW